MCLDAIISLYVMTSVGFPGLHSIASFRGGSASSKDNGCARCQHHIAPALTAIRVGDNIDIRDHPSSITNEQIPRLATKDEGYTERQRWLYQENG